MEPRDKVSLRDCSLRGGGKDIASLATLRGGYRPLWTCAESSLFKSSIRRPQSCKAIECFPLGLSSKEASSRDLFKR